MKILVLEDNQRLNATIVKRLEAKGYEIESFMDGKDAYAAIDNGYMCFILDISSVPVLSLMSSEMRTIMAAMILSKSLFLSMS